MKILSILSRQNYYLGYNEHNLLTLYLGGIILSFITIFNVSIPIVWIATIISFISTSSFVKFLIKQKLSESFSNGLFLYIIIWKLSYIIFSFEYFIKMPFSIVYFHGGKYGHFLALVVVAIYFYYVSKKNEKSFSKQVHLFILCFIIIYEISINLLQNQIIIAFFHVIIFVILILIHKQKKIKFTQQSFILFIMTELIIISLFESIFTIKALTYIFLALIPFLVTKNRGNKYE